MREGLELSRETVCERADVSVNHLTNIETGKANPSIDVVIRLVELGLGMSMARFFADEPLPRDEIARTVAKIAAFLAGRPVELARRAWRVVRAACDE